MLAMATMTASCGFDSSPDSTPTTPATMPGTPVEDLRAEMPSATAKSTPTTSNAAPDPTSRVAVADDNGPSDDDDDGCKRLTDFDGDQTAQWIVVNDGVMGGRSNGTITASDSAMQFTGNVVTAGGGFTSVRLRLDGNELTDTTRVKLRVRSDQRTYGLTLEDSTQAGQRGVSYRADLTIDDADSWTTSELSFAELRPSVFGQAVDAPPFNPDEASEFGIIIADGLDGDFALEIDWIDACR